MIFLTSLKSIVPIIVIMVLGFYLQKANWFSDEFSGNLSKLIMNVGLPASIFVSVLKYLTLDKIVSLSSSLVFSFLGFIISYIIAFILVKLFKIRPGRKGTFINMFVNANTIFIGLPLNIALFGNKALPYFLVYYITNTVSTWTLGVYLMTTDSKSGQSKGGNFNWKKLLPAPLLGFIVALIFLVAKIPVPDFATSTLTYLGGIVTPMSLLYIGITLAKSGLGTIKLDRDSILALIGKFIVAPLVMYLVLVSMAHGMPADEFKTFIVQASAPALAVLPILANQGDGDVEYATNVVTLSTVLFVIVTPLIVSLLG